MVPGIYNLPTGYRGDTYGPISFYFLNNSGSGISFHNYTGALQVKKFESSSTVVGWYTNDGSMTINGNEVLLLPKNGDCMKIFPGIYNFDLQLSSGNKTRTYVKGKFPIEGDITDL